MSTEAAPAALGPYSQAVKAGSTLYISGQIGFDASTMDFAGESVEAQTTQVLVYFGMPTHSLCSWTCIQPWDVRLPTASTLRPCQWGTIPIQPHSRPVQGSPAGAKATN